MRRRKTAGSDCITSRTWAGLIDQFESNTGLLVDSAYLNWPQKYIYAYDSGNTEYEIEVTRYYDGTYEIANMSRYCRASIMGFSWEDF